MEGVSGAVAVAKVGGVDVVRVEEVPMGVAMEMEMAAAVRVVRQVAAASEAVALAAETVAVGMLAWVAMAASRVGSGEGAAMVGAGVGSPEEVATVAITAADTREVTTEGCVEEVAAGADLGSARAEAEKEAMGVLEAVVVLVRVGGEESWEREATVAGRRRFRWGWRQQR
jgi:hypothetical protein